MQIFKDNYGKVILGVSLLCLVVVLVVLRDGVTSARVCKDQRASNYSG